MKHKNGHTLDVLMLIMLQYVHDICHGYLDHRKQSGLKSHSDLKTVPEGMIGGCVTLCRPGVVTSRENKENRTVGCECGGSQHDLEALKLLFTDLKEVFSQIILRTHSSSHVQFLMFSLLALRPGLSTIFIEYLRVQNFEDPNCSRDVRRNAMAYIGSLLARGKFIPFSSVHSCLEVICSWCNSYIDKQVCMIYLVSVYSVPL